LGNKCPGECKEDSRLSGQPRENGVRQTTNDAMGVARVGAIAGLFRGRGLLGQDPSTQLQGLYNNNHKDPFSSLVFDHRKLLKNEAPGCLGPGASAAGTCVRDNQCTPNAAARAVGKICRCAKAQVAGPNNAVLNLGQCVLV